MIAIVIPYYNYLFFEQTLESLATQTDKRFRVYIGDDCSPTDPADIISKFESSIALTYYKYKENLGMNSLSEHWNRCVSLINDEIWILILGDDDKLDQHVIANFYSSIEDIENSHSSLIRLSSVLIDENNNFISETFRHPQKELAKNSLFRKFKRETRSSLTEYIFSKKVFEKYKFKHYTLAWHSDDMAWIEFSENKPIYTLSNATAFIRFTKHSISGKKENTKLKAEATYNFFVDILKKDLDYTDNDFSFLVDKFVFFLKLQKKFSIKISFFLITLFYKRKQFAPPFFLVKEYLSNKKTVFKKALKSNLIKYRL